MACYLTDLCNEVARPGIVSAEKNLKHKGLLRCLKTCTPNSNQFFFFFNVSIMLGIFDH